MTPTPPEVVPAQVDREAALEAYYSCYDSTPNDLWMKALIAGKHDDDPQVQLLARHRLATIEKCAKVCESQVRLGYEGYDLTGFVGENRIARTCATAIRNLAPPPPPVDVGEGG